MNNGKKLQALRNKVYAFVRQNLTRTEDIMLYAWDFFNLTLALENHRAIPEAFDFWDTLEKTLPYVRVNFTKMILELQLMPSDGVNKEALPNITTKLTEDLAVSDAAADRVWLLEDAYINSPQKFEVSFLASDQEAQNIFILALIRSRKGII